MLVILTALIYKALSNVIFTWAKFLDLASVGFALDGTAGFLFPNENIFENLKQKQLLFTHCFFFLLCFISILQPKW